MQINTITTADSAMMQRKFEAIIFDMDGTILDTEILWEQGNKHILATYAPHLTPDEIHAIIHDRKGIRTPHELATMLQKHCIPHMTLADIQTIKTAHVFHLYETKGVSFIPYFHEFHNKLSELGLKSAVATNATQEAVEKIIIKTPLRDYFNEHIYTINVVDLRYKPNPDIYLHAAKMLGVEPHHCIAIEDSSGGIKAAKAAGMYCIGINTGKNRDILKQADEIVECFSEINLEKLLNLEV